MVVWFHLCPVLGRFEVGIPAVIKFFLRFVIYFSALASEETIHFAWERKMKKRRQIWHNFIKPISICIVKTVHASLKIIRTVLRRWASQITTWRCSTRRPASRDASSRSSITQPGTATTPDSCRATSPWSSWTFRSISPDRRVRFVSRKFRTGFRQTSSRRSSAGASRSSETCHRSLKRLKLL